MSFTSTAHFDIEECYSCHVPFAMTKDFRRARLRDRRTLWCPNGHGQVYSGKSDAQKLEEEQARNTHLKDQLGAAEAEAEHRRWQLVRDRQRWINGVCPCCNRNFSGLAQHVRKQHPDYDPANLDVGAKFKCSCHREFETARGLRIHQSQARPDNWTDPNRSDYWRHLTVVGA